jgi:hypothetical protein
MGVLRVLDRTGDTAVVWDPDDADSVAAARERFVRELRRHRVPFARQHGEAANRARPVVAFDADAEEIVFTSPVTGG